MGVYPLDVDSDDKPPSRQDHARREAFAKRDAQQRAQQRMRDSHLAQQHRVQELERMLEQEREARRASSVQETTTADSLDLSSMYEGHDQHAHRHRDTTSSSALHLEPWLILLGLDVFFGPLFWTSNPYLHDYVSRSNFFMKLITRG